MDVVNETGYPHLLVRTALYGDHFAAALVVRVVYQLSGGKYTPVISEDWPLSNAPWVSDYGPIESDGVLKRGEVDLFVFGKAKAPNGSPVKRMKVRVQVPGKMDHLLEIIGNRKWVSGLFGLSASEPEAFTEMPLTLYNAFGGYDEWDSLKFPFPNNPHGKGFIWQKETAAGKPLPNIENPAQLITKWSDKPLPVGTVPIQFCEKRIKRSVDGNEKGITRFDATYFNSAFNDMIVPNISAGEKVIVSGVKEKGDFIFEIPPTPFSLILQFGEKTYERFFKIEQVGLEPDKSRAFITYRYSFNYTMRPKELRILTLQQKSA